MTPDHPAAPPPPPRRYDIDALRALAFALVMLYHVGMYYVADWHWHIKSASPQEWLQWPMRALNLWRMPLVFVVSGLALAMATHRGVQAGSAAQRSLRLLLPLAFGMAVVVPYQAYVQALDQGVVGPGWGAFLARYFTGGPWPAHAFDGAEFGVTWNHLWFLPYLWLYTMALLGLRALLAWRGRGAGTPRPAAHPVWTLLWPLALWWLATLLLWPHFPPTHDLVNDAWMHAVYGTAFVFGYRVAHDTRLWAWLLAGRWGWLAAAAVCALGVWGGFATGMARRLWADAYAWCVLLAALAWAHRALNRPWRWLVWSRESVYPWYLWHQTLIVAVAFALRPWGWGAGVEAAVVLGGTVLGCALLSAGMRRVAWLRPLVGLPPRKWRCRPGRRVPQ